MTGMHATPGEKAQKPFILSVTAKEAIKTALALVLVYWIALKVAWMNPYWAGWAVAMVSLPTAGQSIHKGALRLAGTVPGCAAALIILALAPQDRWGAILLCSAWVFFTTYMKLNSRNHSYFWNVAGFVSLVIVTTGPASPENLFEHAVFRTVETAMGVVVYTLVTVFLWPRSNEGAIRKAGADLLATQAARLRAARPAEGSEEEAPRLDETPGREVTQLAAFGAAIQAEGSESYEVHEQRPNWERLLEVSTAIMGALDRWQLDGSQDRDLQRVLPNLDPFVEELGARFDAARSALRGDAVGHRASAISLHADGPSLRDLSPLDRAAVSVVKRELEDLERLTGEMLDCAAALADPSSKTRNNRAQASSSGTQGALRLPVPDRDHLRGAALVPATLIAGALIWIYWDPPGHAGWMQFPASVAMAFAATQQFTATSLLKPVAIGSALGLGAYVFIMPHLSSFVGLGSLLFACMFATCFFFTGLGRFGGIIGILNEISVQNQQSYNFAAMANAYVFTLLGFVLVFFMSYMLRSPRPEKAVLGLLGRFFRSAEFLISEAQPGRTDSRAWRWRIAFHRHEMSSMPSKLEAWGKAINRDLFPSNQAQQTAALVAALRAIAHRIEELLEARGSKQSDELARALSDDVAGWRDEIKITLAQWASRPEGEISLELRQRLANWLADLQKHVDSVADEEERRAIPEDELEGFYRVLGSYRGVSEALSLYAKAASAINWPEWREERFT